MNATNNNRLTPEQEDYINALYYKELEQEQSQWEYGQSEEYINQKEWDEDYQSFLAEKVEARGCEED